jgi:hypothetical protein
MNISATTKEREPTEFRQVNGSGYSPAAGHLEWIIPLGVFVGCVAYLCIPLRYSTLEPDEGIVLQGAERVLHGQVPYRDFFSFYTPGSFYFLALWLRIFGDCFAVARASIAIVGAICSVLTYLLARRVCTVGMSVFVAVLATIAGTGFRFLVLHNWYSTLLSCLALYTALRFLENGKALWAFGCAWCASLTFLFEQSKGAGVCLGLALGAVILHFSGRMTRLKKAPISAIALGFAGPLLLAFAYFSAHHATGIMVRSWIWPLNHYTQANHVPYGFQNWTDNARAAIFQSGPLWTRAVKVLAISPNLVIPVLPLIAVGLLLYLVMRVWRRQTLSPSAEYYILVCSTLSGLLASVVITRADILHFIYLAPFLYVVLAWILGSPDLGSRWLRVLRPYLSLYVTIAFGLLGMAILLQATGARNRIETRRGVITTGGKDSVLEYLQSHVEAESHFLVYPYLPLYNYLTATRSPSGYDYFQPGMNTREQALEIVASLESQPAEAVLVEPWFAEKIANSWPGTPLNAIADDPVGDYISRNYRVCRLLSSSDGWRFQYMVRKDGECP